MTDEPLRHDLDVRAAASKLVAAREVFPGSEALARFRAAVREQGREGTASALAEHVAVLASHLEGLEPEECDQLARLIVDLHSLRRCGLGPPEDELRTLIERVRAAFGAEPRSRVRPRLGWMREALDRFNPHGSDWWFPRLLRASTREARRAMRK